MNRLRQLNYHHLLYFRTVVREGGIQPAARTLGLAHPTVSGQLRQLEDQLGQPLFDRSGRRLALTDTGRLVFRYADEIFSLGVEMLQTLDGQPADRPPPLLVGVDDGMPKTLARMLLDVALELPARVVCEQDRHDRLLAELAVHRLDVLLTDAPLPPGSHVKAFNHFLGECGSSFLAVRRVASRLRKRFPASLHGAPFLAPTEGTTMRRAVTRYFQQHDLEPTLIAEIADSGLLKAFGAAGHGVFCVPEVMAEAVCSSHKVEVVGHAEDLRWRFHAISPERRVTNPAVAAICDAGIELLGDHHNRK